MTHYGRLNPIAAGLRAWGRRADLPSRPDFRWAPDPWGGELTGKTLLWSLHHAGVGYHAWKVAVTGKWTTAFRGRTGGECILGRNYDSPSTAIDAAWNDALGRGLAHGKPRGGGVARRRRCVTSWTPRGTEGRRATSGWTRVHPDYWKHDSGHTIARVRGEGRPYQVFEFGRFRGGYVTLASAKNAVKHRVIEIEYKGRR